jgi:hypothetical protein
MEVGSMSARIRWTCLTLASLLGVGILLADASAQGTSVGAFGSRTLGGSTSSNRTSGATGSTSKTGSTAGGMGQGGTGTTGGALGTGAPTGERYVRGNQGAFVGADSSDGALNSYSQQAGGLNNMMGNQMMMQAFRQSQQQNQNQNQKQQNKLTVRTPFKVDSIRVPQLSTTFTSRMTVRYANLPALKGRGNIATTMEGDILVLRGQVDTAADRKLAEDLLSLEPGVNLVRNELEIAQSALPIPVSTNPGSNRAAPASAEPSVPRRVCQPLERYTTASRDARPVAA